MNYNSPAVPHAFRPWRAANRRVDEILGSPSVQEYAILHSRQTNYFQELHKPANFKPLGTAEIGVIIFLIAAFLFCGVMSLLIITHAATQAAGLDLELGSIIAKGNAFVVSSVYCFAVFVLGCLVYTLGQAFGLISGEPPYPFKAD